jgi:hypothetical protein
VPAWERVIKLGHRAFYSNAETHYAQAWVIVHFLQEGDRKFRPVLQKLLAKLQAGKGSKIALETALASVDMSKFVAALGRYIEGM